MKTGTKFNKITIDTAKGKANKFGLAHDVYTTAMFGDTQPLGCRLLVPNSKTTLSMRQLVRMDPLVVPTYGRIKAKSWNMFVGMSDLLPKSFPAFLAKAQIAPATINGVPSVPSTLPYMPLCDVSSMILYGARITAYVCQPQSPNVTADDNANLTRWNTMAYDAAVAVAWRNAHSSDFFYGGNPGRVPGYSGGWIKPSALGSQLASSLVPFSANGAQNAAAVAARIFMPSSQTSLESSWDYVDLSTADYVLRATETLTVNGTASDYKFAYAVKLSAMGKRLRKILLGLGYQINFASSRDVCVLPLFAYYKAWFDTFGLTLYQNYESTAAAQLLKTFDNHFYSNGVFDWSVDYFAMFVYDLGSTYVTELQDYISAHQQQDAIGSAGGVSSDDVKQRGFVNNIVLATMASQHTAITGIGQDEGGIPRSTVNDITGHVYINRVQHTEVDAELLKILYKWTNRETIAGKRIAELLRAGGFGKYVDEQKTNFIGYEELDLDVTDINATADSQNSVAGKNSILGEYVGKGIGVTRGEQKTMTFENDEYGYWVTLFAVVPESGYCQGLDMTLLKIDADQFYSRDFDGIGMELQPMLVVAGGEDWSVRSDHNEFEKSFGMVPRHSCFKVAQNICNGDFSLRSRRDAYLPYSMDKVLQYGDRLAVPVAGQTNPTFDVQKYMDIGSLPISGLAWRYLNRYPWLTQFERIFSYEDANSDLFRKFVLQMANLVNYEIIRDDEDHFTCINVMDMVTYAPMLPIEDSYGTTDENDGNGDTTFSKA